MKIKIKSLKQELKGPNDELKTQIIRAFIRAEPGSDHSELKSKLSKLGIQPCEAVSYLNKEEVAPQLYTKALEIHNSFCENKVEVDPFGNVPQMGHDPNQTPGGNKNAEPGRNFMQENTMKISQEYLKQIIQEEISKILESSRKEEDEEYDDPEAGKSIKDITPNEPTRNIGNAGRSYGRRSNRPGEREFQKRKRANNKK